MLLYIEPSDHPLEIEEQSLAILEPPEQGLFIGQKLEDQFNELIATNVPFVVQESDLLRHVFICGIVGAGKTVLGKIFLEEAALKGIPVIAIDLKGDISSMALMMSGEDPEEFFPWVTPSRGKSTEEIAAHEAEFHSRNLGKWGLSKHSVRLAKKSVGVNIFTPRSNDGFRLALSAFPELSEDLEAMEESDVDAYDSLIEFLADQFVSRLTVNRKLSERGKDYIFEIIKTCFSRGIAMHGYDGVKRLSLIHI